MIGRRFRGVMLFRRDDPLDPLHRFLHFAIQGVIQYGGPFLRIFRRMLSVSGWGSFR